MRRRRRRRSRSRRGREGEREDKERGREKGRHRKEGGGGERDTMSCGGEPGGPSGVGVWWGWGWGGVGWGGMQAGAAAAAGTAAIRAAGRPAGRIPTPGAAGPMRARAVGAAQEGTGAGRRSGGERFGKRSVWRSVWKAGRLASEALRLRSAWSHLPGGREKISIKGFFETNTLIFLSGRGGGGEGREWGFTV